jgi:hypothetical protein
MRGLAICVSLALSLLAPDAAARGKGKKGKQDKPKGAEVVKEGKIRVVRGMGAEPQLTDQNDKRHLCTGPLREELLRLHGHKVKAWGTVGDKKLMIPTFRVARYEITDSGGGRKPMVGMLRREGKERYILERQKEGNLTIKARAAFKRRLESRVGCKIWILGDLEDSTLRAYKFGWISCKAPKVIKPRKETSK